MWTKIMNNARFKSSGELRGNNATVPCLLNSFLNQIDVKTVSSKTLLTFPVWDVKAGFSRMSRETAREMSTVSA